MTFRTVDTPARRVERLIQLFPTSLREDHAAGRLIKQPFAESPDSVTERNIELVAYAAQLVNDKSVPLLDSVGVAKVLREIPRTDNAYVLVSEFELAPGGQPRVQQFINHIFQALHGSEERSGLLSSLIAGSTASLFAKVPPILDMETYSTHPAERQLFDAVGAMHILGESVSIGHVTDFYAMPGMADQRPSQSADVAA